MTILRTSAASLAAALMLGACTANPPAAPAGMAASGQRQCFRPAQVNGFHAIDGNRVHVMVGANDVYELQLFGSCQGIDFSTRVGIRSTNGMNWVCRGYDAELIVPNSFGGAGGADRCAVTDVRRLSPAEIEAMRAARRG